MALIGVVLFPAAQSLLAISLVVGRINFLPVISLDLLSLLVVVNCERQPAILLFEPPRPWSGSF